MAEGHILNILNSQQERVTNAQTVINSDHGNIHAHEGWSLSVNSSTLLASSWIRVQFNTSTSHYVHLKAYHAYADGTLCRWSIREATTASTFTPSTTALVAYNKSRVNSSAYTLGAQLFRDPLLVIDTGNLVLEQSLVGSTGTNQAKTGTESQSFDAEWVLKQGTTYTFSLDNIGGVTGFGGIHLFWYEEENA
jgi:hypothetical protein